MKATVHGKSMVKQLTKNIVVDTLPRTVGSVFNDITRSSFSSKHAIVLKRQRFLQRFTNKSKVGNNSVDSTPVSLNAN
jgi:hypothetical protein